MPDKTKVDGFTELCKRTRTSSVTRWISDVDGVRVVIETSDYPETSAEDGAELQGIVDSIQIEP